MELETAFYITGLVFMGLMIALIIALLIVVLVIKSKIDNVHNMVTERVDQVKSVANKISIAVGTLRHFVKR